jgi:transcriptional regulator with XRE-family HTH domain
MIKRTLGSVVKQARDGARMTQRELASAIGVKASHIAYIENGQRKPSIALINRLGETLGLDTRELLVLAHPEAKQIIDGARPSAKKATKHGNGSYQIRLCSDVMRSHVANSRF